MVGRFAERGYCRFARDPALAAWAQAARGPARAAATDPELRARWLVCEGTWFVGVDALPNDASGAIGGVALAGAAIDFARSLTGPLPLHRAQVSVVWPGYPKPREGESEAAFAYRKRRDGAHLDGLKVFGPQKQRRIGECHAWILGIALNDAGAGASPLVVWEGSHVVMARALRAAVRGVPPEGWRDLDLSEVYQQARREVFARCRRVELALAPGEASLMHRLCLHGVAPWRAGAGAAQGDGRMVAYFRPEMPGGPAAWLAAD